MSILLCNLGMGAIAAGYLIWIREQWLTSDDRRAADAERLKAKSSIESWCTTWITGAHKGNVS